MTRARTHNVRQTLRRRRTSVGLTARRRSWQTRAPTSGCMCALGMRRTAFNHTQLLRQRSKRVAAHAGGPRARRGSPMREGWWPSAVRVGTDRRPTWECAAVHAALGFGRACCRAGGAFRGNRRKTTHSARGLQDALAAGCSRRSRSSTWISSSSVPAVTSCVPTWLSVRVRACTGEAHSVCACLCCTLASASPPQPAML